jgi:hypothetical protein
MASGSIVVYPIDKAYFDLNLKRIQFLSEGMSMHYYQVQRCPFNSIAVLTVYIPNGNLSVQLVILKNIKRPIARTVSEN